MQGPLHDRSHAGPVLNPVAAAAPYVGIPWRARGRTPDAWDCLGCVRFLRRKIFGLETPGFGLDTYTSTDVASSAEVERLVHASLSQWVQVPPRPGAVIVFRVFDRDAHVGLVLSRSDFVHSFGGQETTILRLDDHSWSRRIRGFYDTSDDAPHA